MPGPAFLDGERVALRTFEEEDIEFVRDGVNDPQVWKSIGGQTTPSNLAQERKFFEDLNHSETAVALVIAAGGTRVGVIELDPINWEKGVAEVAFWIAPDHRGEGYATDALRTVADYAFDQLRLHKLTAEVFAFNRASAGTVETVGFSEEGRLREEDFVDGRYVDVCRYGLLSSDRRDAG